MNGPRLEIRPAGAKGRGLFAAEPIARGQRIVELAGRILKSHELTEDLLALQIGPDEWLCSDGTSLDDMANHSCEPNAGFLGTDLALYALTDIAGGDEITWDYSTSIDEPGWELLCGCGAKSCRGIIRPWRELADADRNRLQPMAMDFIRVFHHSGQGEHRGKSEVS